MIQCDTKGTLYHWRGVFCYVKSVWPHWKGDLVTEKGLTSWDYNLQSLQGGLVSASCHWSEALHQYRGECHHCRDFCVPGGTAFVTGQVTWTPVATSKGPQSSEVLSFSCLGEVRGWERRASISHIWLGLTQACPGIGRAPNCAQA